jgi:hypothetical protein
MQPPPANIRADLARLAVIICRRFVRVFGARPGGQIGSLDGQCPASRRLRPISRLGAKETPCFGQAVEFVFAEVVQLESRADDVCGLSASSHGPDENVVTSSPQRAKRRMTT